MAKGAAATGNSAKAPAGMAATAAEAARATEAAMEEAGVETAADAAEAAVGAIRAAGAATTTVAPSCSQQRHGTRNDTRPGTKMLKPHSTSSR